MWIPRETSISYSQNSSRAGLWGYRLDHLPLTVPLPREVLGAIESLDPEEVDPRYQAFRFAIGFQIPKRQTYDRLRFMKAHTRIEGSGLPM